MSGQKLKISHCGFHTCPVRAKHEEKLVGGVKDLLKKDPSLKPSEVQSALLVSSLRVGETSLLIVSNITKTEIIS